MSDKSAKLDVNTKHEVAYCIPISIRDEQIRANIKRVTDRIEPCTELKTEPVAIVGYGPSLANTWREIKKFKTIITCSGSHKFLLSKGITPTHHCEVDPRRHKIELLGEPHKDVQYLPASCVHPDYIKHILASGADVKLWHVFARDGESEQVIPRGEWSITGGSDAGMRAMTIARFLGYTDFHIFGMDGCEGKTGKHAAAHPNQPKGHAETVYGGKTYRTTPALLECGKQVFHELDHLQDVTAKFYGDGLIQAMAKDYVRKPMTVQSDIAAMKPELISDEMRRLNRELHEDNVMYGIGGGKYAETVIKMKTENINSVLDYGCGKGHLAKALPFPIWQFDPAIPEHAESPRPADLVVCTDVLEHIEPDKLDVVLDDLRRCVLQVGYFVIHLGAAQKTYADGRNAHLIQEPADWWVKKLSQYFDVATAQQRGKELHVVVGVKTIKDDLAAIIGVKGKDNIKSRFYTPNKTTRWRAETLASKEPVTIDWLQRIPKDAVLYDVGANVGGYAVWAGVRGVNVIAFEPEAENYAMLVKNLALNNLTSKAFCLAVSDTQKLDVLHMSDRGLGGSCHSFGEAVDAFGAHRNGNHPEQGCVGMSIDELVERGLPKPEYIKIDVDGFEPKVIKGAHKTLKGVKSMVIEVNPALPAHLAMVDELTKVYGFTYDEKQVKASTRTQGAFSGVAEYVFTRQSKAEKHILAAVEAAELVSEPYPHLIVSNVLPADDYKALLASLPASEAYVPIKKVRGVRGYPERFVAAFDRPEWIDALGVAIRKKFGLAGDYKDETLLIKDKIGYSISPHTDHPQRVASAILYLAQDAKQPELGTWICTPRDSKMKCAGGPHHPADKFNYDTLVPYTPNSMFVFLKTDNSFHSVKTTDAVRNVFLWDLRRE